MKDSIVKFLGESRQVTDCDTFARSAGYKGFYLNDDDAPLFTYEFFPDFGDIKELKSTMIELRNDGLIELLPAIDSDGKPNGSGWAITEKGLKYFVDNFTNPQPELGR